MGGVVLETLSSKKLLAFFLVLISFQAAFFLLGGLIAPAPNTSDQILTSKCIDRSTTTNDEWFFTRPRKSNFSCKEVLPDGDFSDVVPAGITADQVVFVAQFPLPKNDYDLKMTKWFQQMIAVLMLDIKYQTEFQVKEDSMMTFDVRLGYRNHNDPENGWKELAHSRETRPLNCKLDPQAQRHADHNHSTTGHFYYDCEVLPLFTLGSVYYDYYLVNLRLPIIPKLNINTKIGHLQDLWLVEIHQNGGFTKVWFALKTFIFPVTLLALVFFWRRVSELERKPNFLERTTLAMGIVMSILNFPIEWLSLLINIPFWLVLSDIRQGAFYATLVCFWLVFTGEHQMDRNQSSPDSGSFLSKCLEKWGLSKQYWSKLILVAGASTALCIFELAERGVQLRNPFYSIWSHPTSSKIGFTMMVVGAVCAVLYLIYLSYLVTRAFISMIAKKRMLHSLPEDRRIYYGGIIYRFSILLGYTILCAILTVAFFICSQLNEDQWKWGAHSLEYSSAFITGVYGMWNVYVFAVLCLYAPSHKYLDSGEQQVFEQLIPEDSNAESVLMDPMSSGRVLRSTRFKEVEGFNFIQKTAFE